MGGQSPALDLIGLNELPTIDRWDLERRARGAVQPVYLGQSVALCRVLARYKMFVDTTDVGFGAHLLLDGFWESWLTTFIAARVKPGDAVIDVGANHGYYTLLMSDLVGPAGRVAAVEPNPNICRLLRKSVSLNGFASRVTILEQAATGVDGADVSLCLPPNESKNAYLSEYADQAVARGETVVSVVAGRLATALRDWDRLDFVKIDVEGAEEAAVEGLFPLLERHRPRMVLEFNALRCAAPRALLERLIKLYGSLAFVHFDGAAHPAEIDSLLDVQQREDWLLYLSPPA
ncbi:MAG TPA: FkbM family methyltransferase [Caulobacteraceae bacterium]|nr:FkbM family methyltransferase [Caulobacteraceae bacterium]